MHDGLPAVSAVVAEHAAEALRAGRVVLQDFYRSTVDGQIRLAIMVPIFDETDGKRPLGVIVLRIDPSVYLYPFIINWPVPSETAETLIVRRDGNDVLYLNDLRHQANAEFTLRVPLSRTDVPAVRAVLGETGVIEGHDYHDVPVLAVARTVPDSSWVMIAKTDLAELNAPLRERLWQVIVMIGVLILGTAAGVGLVWRQQSVRHYRKLALSAEGLRENELKYRALFETANDAILLFTGDHWIDCNAGALSIFGCSREQIIGAHPSRFSPPMQPDGRSSAEEAIKKIHLAYTVGEHAVTLLGERLRLAEIWQNMIENACKFMGGQAAPRIEIGVEMRGTETVFFVRDNGIGLDPRHHAKIFNLFEKLDPSAEGSGLGLTLIKRIIELYHGRIWVESPGAGQGTCFYFTLPGAVQGG